MATLTSYLAAFVLGASSIVVVAWLYGCISTSMTTRRLSTSSRLDAQERAVALCVMASVVENGCDWRAASIVSDLSRWVSWLRILHRSQWSSMLARSYSELLVSVLIEGGQPGHVLQRAFWFRERATASRPSAGTSEDCPRQKN